MTRNTTQNYQDVNKAEKSGTIPDLSRLVDQILSILPDRTKDIFKRRFGLGGGKPETLEHIGQNYNITRERVRQIVSDAQKTISANLAKTDFTLAEESLIFTIEKNNGIIKETELLERKSADGSKANAILFLAECSAKIFPLEVKGTIEKSWATVSGIEEAVSKVAQKAEEALKEGKKTLSSEEISQKLEKSFNNLSQAQILDFLAVSRRVKKNKFEKWGVHNWPEINPKGTKEKVYLVLKENKKPLHFLEIASLIDKFGLGKKKAHPQTVHNELIKDDRFVLIGRGMYALAEWGYTEGTIKDVLQEIIGKSAHPMKREEILSEVMKRRKVKKSTILINLNNRGIFEKKNDAYILKK